MLRYRILADIVLVIHFTIVLFVIFGLVLTLLGGAMNWHWVRNFWFRLAHVIAIGMVVAQAWSGVVCPLTTLENHLREQGGEATYPGSFITYWIGELLFYDAPPWVFTSCYTLFGAGVMWAFIRIPPRWPRFKAAPESTASRRTPP